MASMAWNTALENTCVPLKLELEQSPGHSCDLHFSLDQQRIQRFLDDSNGAAASENPTVAREQAQGSYLAYARSRRGASSSVESSVCSGGIPSSYGRKPSQCSALLTSPRVHDIHLKIEGPHLGDLPQDFPARLQAFLADELHMPAIHIAVEQGCIHLLATLLELGRGAGIAGPTAARLRGRFFARANSATQLPARLLAFMREVLPEGAAPGHVTVWHNQQSYELDAGAVHDEPAADAEANAEAAAEEEAEEEAVEAPAVASENLPTAEPLFCEKSVEGSAAAGLASAARGGHGYMPVGGVMSSSAGSAAAAVTAAGMAVAASSSLAGVAASHEGLSGTWGSSAASPLAAGFGGSHFTSEGGRASTSAAAISSGGGLVAQHIVHPFLDANRLATVVARTTAAAAMEAAAAAAGSAAASRGGALQARERAGGRSGGARGAVGVAELVTDDGIVTGGGSRQRTGGYADVAPLLTSHSSQGPSRSRVEGHVVALHDHDHNFDHNGRIGHGHIHSLESYNDGTTSHIAVVDPRSFGYGAGPAGGLSYMVSPPPQQPLPPPYVGESLRQHLLRVPQRCPEGPTVRPKCPPAMTTEATAVPPLLNFSPVADVSQRSLPAPSLEGIPSYWFPEEAGVLEEPYLNSAAVAAVVPIDPRVVGPPAVAVADAASGGRYGIGHAQAAVPQRRELHPQQQQLLQPLPARGAPSRFVAADSSSDVMAICSDVQMAMPGSAAPMHSMHAAGDGGCVGNGVVVGAARVEAATARQSAIATTGGDAGSQAWVATPLMGPPPGGAGAADAGGVGGAGGAAASLARPHNVVNFHPSGGGGTSSNTTAGSGGGGGVAAAITINWHRHVSPHVNGAVAVPVAPGSAVAAADDTHVAAAAAADGYSGSAPFVATPGQTGTSEWHGTAAGSSGGVAWAPQYPSLQRGALSTLHPQLPSTSHHHYHPHQVLPPSNASPGAYSRAASPVQLAQLQLAGGSNPGGNQSSVMSIRGLLGTGVDVLEALTRPVMPPPQFSAGGGTSLAPGRRPQSVELLRPPVAIWPPPPPSAAAAAGSTAGGSSAGGGATATLLPAAAASSGVSLYMRCPDVIAQASVPRRRRIKKAAAAVPEEPGDGLPYNQHGSSGSSLFSSGTVSGLEASDGGDSPPQQQSLGGQVSQLVAWCRTGIVPVVQLDDSSEGCSRATLLLSSLPTAAAAPPPPQPGAVGGADGGAGAAAAAAASPNGNLPAPATHLVYIAWRRGRALGPVCPVLLLPPSLEGAVSELKILSVTLAAAAAPSAALKASYLAFLTDLGLWLEAMDFLAAATATVTSAAAGHGSSPSTATVSMQSHSTSVLCSSTGATAATSVSDNAAAAASTRSGHGPVAAAGGGSGDVRRVVSAPPPQAAVAAVSAPIAIGGGAPEAVSPFQTTAAFGRSSNPAAQQMSLMPLPPSLLQPAVPSAVRPPSPLGSANSPQMNNLLLPNIYNTSADTSSCSTDSCERLARVAEEVLNLGCDLLSYAVACGAVVTARLLMGLLLTQGPLIQSLPTVAVSPGSSVAGSIVLSFVVAAASNSPTSGAGDTEQQRQQQRAAFLRAVLEVCRTGNQNGFTLLHMAVLSRSLPMLRLVASEWPEQLGLSVSELNRLNRAGHAPDAYLPPASADGGGGGEDFAAAAAVLLQGLGSPSAVTAESPSPPLRSIWGLQTVRDVGGVSGEVPWRAAAAAVRSSPPPSASAAVARTAGSSGGGGWGGYGNLHGRGVAVNNGQLDLAAEVTSPSLRLLHALANGRAGSSAHSLGCGGGGGGGGGGGAATAASVAASEHDSFRTHAGLEGAAAAAAGSDAAPQGLPLDGDTLTTSHDTAGSNAADGALSSPLAMSLRSSVGQLRAALTSASVVFSGAASMSAVSEQWERRLQGSQRRPLWAALLLLLGSVQALIAILSAMPHARALPASASLLALPGALLWLPSLCLLLAAVLAAAAGLLLPLRWLAAAPWLPAAVTAAGRAAASVLSLAAAARLPLPVPYPGAAAAGAGGYAMVTGRYAFGAEAAVWLIAMTLVPTALEAVQPAIRTALLFSEYGMSLLYVLTYGGGTVAAAVALVPYAACNILCGAALATILEPRPRLTPMPTGATDPTNAFAAAAIAATVDAAGMGATVAAGFAPTAADPVPSSAIGATAPTAAHEGAPVAAVAGVSNTAVLRDRLEQQQQQCQQPDSAPMLGRPVTSSEFWYRVGLSERTP